MVTDREAHIEAIRAAPDDDAPRLVYADRVRESGDEELAALIQVGVLCCDTGLDPAGMECVLCRGKGWRHRCEHDGCREPGDPCFLPLPNEPYADEPEAYYCGAHAHDHGFCCGCGSYWAGVGSFEASRTGLCEHCEAEIENDSEDHDDWYDAQEEALMDYDDDFGV
jgi:uncharacterized protein (TIGR02996 family)